MFRSIPFAAFALAAFSAAAAGPVSIQARSGRLCYYANVSGEERLLAPGRSN